MDQLRARYGQVNLTYLPLAVGLYLTGASVRTIRWKVILGPLARISFVEAFAIGISGSLLNYLVPIRTGELAKSWLVRQRHQVPISRSLATVVVDRYLDFSAVILVGGLALLVGFDLRGHLRSLVALGLFMVVGFILVTKLIINHHSGIRRATSGILRHLSPKKYVASLEEVVVNFTDGLIAVQRPLIHLWALFGLSILAILLDGMFFYLLFLSFQSIPSFASVFLGYVLLTLTYLLPAAPGYVGSTEIFGALIFSSLGLDITLAASVVVLGHALTSAILLSGGVLSLYCLRRSLPLPSHRSDRELNLGALRIVPSQRSRGPSK